MTTLPNPSEEWDEDDYDDDDDWPLRLPEKPLGVRDYTFIAALYLAGFGLVAMVRPEVATAFVVVLCAVILVLAGMAVLERFGR